MEISTEFIDDKLVKTLLPNRPIYGHKGTFGRVLAMVGSLNYLGAAYLACGGAARSGAGLVTLAIAKTLQPLLAGSLIETTYLLLDDEEGEYTLRSVEDILESVSRSQVFLTGCGLQNNKATINLLTHTILSKRFPLIPIVMDAGALTAISNVHQWFLRIGGDLVVTPHLGEMSILTGIAIEDIEKNKTSIAKDKAAEWNAIVVLKGAYTVIASPDGVVRHSPFANPGLASAGTGDVLAGIISGLIAQGLDVFDAAVCGVYLHGHTADDITLHKGNAGILANDILDCIPISIKKIKES
jgi:NAD(P)H-hydrate epimerase